jgi:FkbM family methyltransferase
MRREGGPAVICANTPIKGWISFSDYWDFHNGVSVALRRLIDESLRTTKSVRPVAMDIGAHLGLFTAELAGRGFVEVHAFEPAPSTFAKLKQNIEASPSARAAVTLNCVAMGPNAGAVEFQIEPNAPATNHVRLNPAQNATTAKRATQTVRMTTLDAYCAEHGIRHIDFLKMDTEGLEPFVLEGAQACLENRRVSTMVLECCPQALQRAGSSVADLHYRLLSLGYAPHELERNGKPGAALTVDQLERVARSGNLSACGNGADIVALPRP